MDNDMVAMMKNTFQPLYSTPTTTEFESFEEFIEHVKATNTYLEIFKICNQFKTKLVFSCVELKDDEIDGKCLASPEGLMAEIKDLSQSHSVSIIAENSEVLTHQNAAQKIETISQNLPGFFEFTYMRMKDFSTKDDPFKDVYSSIVNAVSKQESKNFYEKDESFFFVEINVTFDNPLNAQKLMEALNQNQVFGHDVENMLITHTSISETQKISRVLI